MIDVAVPAGMMFATLGLALGFAPLRTAMMTVVVAALSAGGAALFSYRLDPETGIILCCAVIVSTSIFVYWPRYLSAAVLVGLAIVAGGLAGSAIRSAPAGSDISASVLALSAALPARIAVRHGYAVAPRVVMSWLLAVTLLIAALLFGVAHPGYVPDHRG